MVLFEGKSLEIRVVIPETASPLTESIVYLLRFSSTFSSFVSIIPETHSGFNSFSPCERFCKHTHTHRGVCLLTNSFLYHTV